jgi:hypothetical protein
MVAFNTALIKTWENLGYQFILVLPRDKYGVLRPLAQDKPVKRGYTIQINEINLIQMAEDYFLTKEKDALVPSRSMQTLL